MKDRVESGEVELEYLKTTEMVADLMTKPLQGELFRKLRRVLLNWEQEPASSLQGCVEDGAAEDGAAAVGVVDEGGAADQAPAAPRVTTQASLSSPLRSAYAVLLTLWRET